MGPFVTTSFHALGATLGLGAITPKEEERIGKAVACANRLTCAPITVGAGKFSWQLRLLALRLLLVGSLEALLRLKCLSWKRDFAG